MKHIETGNIGEIAVANHLKRKGFSIISTNYAKKWGEIDIIAQFKDKVHFFEVKTISRETKQSVAHETWLPEENVNRRKLQKLLRTIETWVAEHYYEGEWQLNVAAVQIDPKKQKAVVKIIDNVILE